MAEVTAVTAIAALSYGLYSGERQAATAKKGLRLQDEAQTKAEALAASDARQAAEADKRASQKSPDLNVLLGDQQPRANQQSINTDRLLLGRSKLLGA